MTKLIDAQSINDVWSIHTKAMKEYGFDRLLYGMTRYRQGNSVGTPSDFLVLTNHSRTYAEALFQNARYLRGPMAKWALDNTGTQSWSMAHARAARGELSKDEMELMALNAANGVTAGYTISFSGPSDRFAAAISLVAEPGLSQADVDDRWQSQGAQIELLNKVMNLKVKTLPQQNAQPLTMRQKEVLDWIGDGKSVADVSVLMGLSSGTVEKHLRLARTALGAETTAQAILKHAFQNQVFVA
ncbi:MAG: LuxR family transcriptional regulator [Planktomarina sp.]